jgi:hypothetical protein
MLHTNYSSASLFLLKKEEKMNSSIKCIVGMTVCGINAITALHIGLLEFNINLFGAGFFQSNMCLFKYIVGISGAIGLGLLIMKLVAARKCSC